MPYTSEGRWLSPEAVDRQMGGGCPCAGCREYARINGVTPDQAFLLELVEPEYGADGEGFDQFGYNAEGLNAEGYDRDGYDRNGFSRGGYDADGYDADGYGSRGYDRDGFDREGYDYDGYNSAGFNQYGFDAFGFDVSGYDSGGFDRQGFNQHGRNRRGYDRDGYGVAGYDRDGYNRQGLDAAGNERPCDCYDCRLEWGEDLAMPTMTVAGVDTAERGDLDGDWLHNYSYTPNPLTFRHSHGEDKKTVPYFGMEIEMTSDLSELERDIAQVMGMEDRLMYFKSDGSVEGFELVTHPMTAQWAGENFPWHVVEVMAEAGASVTSSCNGLHIHVSRSGFKDEAHLYRWLKLWYRNQTEIIGIAGRNGGEWGGFDPDQRDLHGVHAKARARVRHNPRDGRLVRSSETGVRYSAVNLQNEHTVEVRLFAATTSATVLRTRFDLVAASVEYTRNLPVKKLRGGGWKWDAFMLWLDENSGTYPFLAEREEDSIMAAIRARNDAREHSLTLA